MVDSVIPLPMGPSIDPNMDRVARILGEDGAGLIEPVEEELTPHEKLLALANTEGNFAEAIAPEDLAKIGLEAIADYDKDKTDRKDWEDTAKEALKAAAQEFEGVTKTYPWPKASNIRYPILAMAMLQFNARAYPAVVKGDEAVLCKVIGRDNGRPQMGPQGPVMQVDEAGNPVMGQDGKPQPVWDVEPGAKGARAARVSEYMNTTIFYRMEDWESDTDSLLMQLPVVGCVMRKLWYDSRARKQRAAMVSALNVIVPEGARSIETAWRLTEEIPDVPPETIRNDIRNGRYLDVDLFTKTVDGKPEEDSTPRLLLEHHRTLDLDDDGYAEPYILTLDHSSGKVLRIEPNFGPADIEWDEQKDQVASIKKGRFFVKYPFWPHPKGNFYDLGLGHLLKQVGDVIDTSINQLMDAAAAQNAGGGFIASGVRLQSRAQGSVVRFEPGVYRTVDVPGDVLRNAIVERTLPNPSPITFQILELILGAAKEISGIKDVITGEASNNGQVGTTLALIEQGLQVFNAIYKRVFRALKDEFSLLYENIAKYGGELAERDYMETLDDPAADFKADFSAKDIDIRPVSDPSAVTRMQRMGRAQFVLGTMDQLIAVGGDPREALRRVYEAADIEDIDKLLPPPQPNPEEAAAQQMQKKMTMDRADVDNEAKKAKALRDIAAARKTTVETERDQFELTQAAMAEGAQFGAAAA